MYFLDSYKQIINLLVQTYKGMVFIVLFRSYLNTNNSILAKKVDVKLDTLELNLVKRTSDRKCCIFITLYYTGSHI